MIPTDANSTVSTFSTLYHSGAYLCIGIVAAYLVLKALSARVKWLSATPTRVHDVTIALGVLALFAAPAAAGTTPSLSMVMTAIPVILGIVLPGRSSAAESAIARSPNGGFVRWRLLFVISLVGAIAGCAWWAKNGSTVVGDIVDCTKQDLSGLTQFGAAGIAAAEDSTGQVTTTSLKQLGLTNAVTLGSCLAADGLAAAIAAAKTAIAGSGSPAQSSPLVIDAPSALAAWHALYPGKTFHTAHGDL